MRGTDPKWLKQHILLTLLLRVSDPRAPSNKYTVIYVRIKQQKNRMITLIIVKTVFHKGGLVNQDCICNHGGTSGESILKSDQNLCITVTLSGKPLYPLERTN